MEQSKPDTFPTSDNDEKLVSLNGNSVSDDDEGFVSGDEDFEIGQDKDNDGPFVDAPATVESLDNDNIVVDVDEIDKVVKDYIGLDESGEVLDVNDINLVGEGVERKREEFSDVKAKEDVASDGVDVKLNEEGDSVVDNISAIDVDVVNPGVVVVGESKENADVDDRSVVVDSKVEESSEIGVNEEVKADSVDDKLIEAGDSVVVGETNVNEDVGNSQEVDVDRDLVVEEVERKGEESSETEAKEEVKSDSVDVKLTEEGDSVVETINDIKIDVAAPGVVVVGETKESEVVQDSQEARNFVVDEVEGKREESIETESKEEVTSDSVDVKLNEEGYSLVGETKESEVVEDSQEADIARDFVVEEVERKREESGQVGEKEDVVSDSVDVKLTEEGDSVFDTISSIQVDVAAPGVVVVGETKENEDVENNQEAAVGESEKVEPVGINDPKLTTEGDAIVDTIHVEPVVPGVAVVGEVDKNEAEKVEREVSIESVGDSEESSKGIEVVSKPSTENKFDILEQNPEPENVEIGNEKLGAGAVIDSEDVAGVERSVKKGEAEHEPEPVIANEASENGVASIVNTDREVEIVDKTAGSDLGLNLPENTNAGTLLSNGVPSGDAKGVEIMDKTVDLGTDVNQLESTNADTIQSNGVHLGEDGEVADDTVDMDIDANAGTMQSNGVDSGEEAKPDVSDGEADDLVFGSESAKKFIEELEKESGLDSHTGAGSSLELSPRMDGQIVTDSEEEEGDSDDEEDGKELFDPSALAALLKAATGSDSDGGSITITSQDGSRLFSVERPAGMGSSLRALRPAPQSTRPTLFSPSSLTTGVESEENLSEEEKKKLEKLQQIRVKFLRLVHKLGLSTEEPVAEQVLYRLALLGGRRNTQSFNLDVAKQTALQLESSDGNNLDFSVNILVLGKSGVGKSATINSIFGDEKASIGAFETGTGSAKVVSGYVNGVNLNVVDTPGLKPSAMEQGFNRSILSSVQKLTKKSPPDVVLYVDRLDAQTRDLNDLPMMRTVTSALGQSIWRSVIVTLTHGSSAPPDGPSGTPLSYDVFVSQRSHVVQQSIGHAVGDLRMMSPNLMNPVSLAENHRNCRKNRDGQKILPNGQIWRPQLLLLCYSMKILSEASALSKPQDPFDHRKLFGFRTRSPPLPYMLSSMLQSRPHPKLPSDQGGDGVDSDVDLDDFSDSDGEEDEYDQLPPFKPLKLRQINKLSKEQRKAYFEEYDYRVKLLQKKSWREELKRMREMKKRGKDSVTDYGFNEEDPDSGASAPIAVPLPDMTLPASFDGDSPAYRYRFLEPTSQFLARPVLDSHGWDHDCGYDGVNLEHSLAIINRFPATYTVQVTKDKKDFTFSLDSSISAKHGDKMSTMAGFDIQSMGKQLAYIFRGETKFKNLKKNKAAAGVTFTVLGENVIPGVKIEDQITLGKQYVLVGSAGAVKSQQETAYGANFELQRREADFPIGQVQSTVSMSLVKWRGDLALGLNGLAQFTLGRNSKVAVRAGINNKMSGQVTVRTSSSEHLSLALAAVLPTVLSVYRKLWPAPNEKYSLY